MNLPPILPASCVSRWHRLFLTGLVETIVTTTPLPAEEKPDALHYQLEMITFAVVKDGQREWILKLGNLAYRSTAELKTGLARLPSGSTLRWAPSCIRIGGELLSTAEELQEVRTWCEEKGIKFVVIPAG